MSTDAAPDIHYNPREVEPRIYDAWIESGAFVSKPNDDPIAKTFTMVIPPPNVTGALHLGHALNNTLQDILIRYHRMRGFNTLWQSGTDHAGIATQAVVERRIFDQEGKTRKELGREELVKRIWKWKDEYEARILSQLKLMGCSCDWDRNRFTLDDGLVRAVREMFFRLFKDELIFPGNRLVNWDTQLQTAVSDDEVYHETIKGHFWHFKYPVIDPQPGEPEHVIIATTRPETMLGDTAVAVHPAPAAFFDAQAVALRADLDGASDNEKPAIEQKIEALAERRASHLEQLVTLRDMANEGRMLKLPLVDREIPLVTDEWANPTKGSGCVKITPAHDPNDYEVGKRCGLNPINVLTKDGKIASTFPDNGSTNPESVKYDGLTFADEGRDAVVADMDTLGLLHEVEDRETEVGHSDRSKVRIEPMLSDQWFIKTEDIDKQSVDDRPNDESQSEPRTSVRAAPRSPNMSQGAVLVTWTTYGTWLPGDERGFVSRTPSESGDHILHNLPGEPYDSDEPEVRETAKERMAGERILLGEPQAKSLLQSIAATCERHAIEPLAVAIMSNHTHVLCQTDQPKRELLKLFKGAASRDLTSQFADCLTKGQRWFTKSGSVRYIKTGNDLTAAVEYVQQQENALRLWSFDIIEGSAVDEFETGVGLVRECHDLGDAARTEVRGSLGIRLANGQVIPGLAQAAMDAVNDKRIKIFPRRYGKSYLDWLGEKRDWCISRQLWWGHQIAVWRVTFSAGRTGGLGSTKAIADMRHRLQTELQGLLDKLGEVSGCENDFVVGWHQGMRSAECLICTRTQIANEQLSDVVAHVRRSRPDYEPMRKIWSDDDRCEVAEKISRLLGTIDEEEDVLDTWFSSALWPFSTLGWPDNTDHVKRYYPGSVLCTSRDIITNWVARMVMFGLYAMGEVPFDHVFIHPKILDGRGETMSKSKGNGVDPVDVIHTHGADALRYSMADLCTETQDIRMPVEYICPHCEKKTEQVAALKAETQARKSRGEKLTRKLQPADCTRVQCVHKECGKTFATAWASAELKQELGLARETSDKFDIGRNFCNKLWNAARFAFLNLEGARCDKLDVAALLPEDRWILARLSQTIRRYHECIAAYHFAASVKELREFFWDALCDWYIELTKPRLGDAGESTRSKDEDKSCDTARQVLAFCMDQVLRMWHPTIPFITEQLWEKLGEVAPHRGLPGVADLNTDGLLVSAEFPPERGYAALDDESVISVFSGIQDVVRAVRDLRARCDISPKLAVTATVALPTADCDAFEALAHIVRRMANVCDLRVDPNAKRPANAGSVTIGTTQVFVHDISDDAAERARGAKAMADLEKKIAGKEAKLGNEKFVANAKPEVVEIQRRGLAELVEQRSQLAEHLAELGE